MESPYIEAQDYNDYAGVYDYIKAVDS